MAAFAQGRVIQRGSSDPGTGDGDVGSRHREINEQHPCVGWCLCGAK